jgi:hypothetical protein
MNNRAAEKLSGMRAEVTLIIEDQIYRPIEKDS